MDFHKPDSIFLEGRTFSKWEDKTISDQTLVQIYELAKLGPTSANGCPLRIIFVRSQEDKNKLCACVAEANQEQTQKAPVVALFAYDLLFYEKFDLLFPYADAKSWFQGDLEKTERHAFRNGSLQAAYFILAARKLGVDAGPMSGFDENKVQEAFFEGTSYRVNFICNLGYGQKASLRPRLPRLSFDQVCKIL